MTDETRRKPPPRVPRPDDPEVVRVDEESPPDTDKIPVPLPAPRRLPPMRPPAKEPTPLQIMKGRDSSYVELAAQLATVIASQEMILSTQRKMALQLDGYGQAVNQRFDIFHRELALIRATVTGDHAPRLDAVEKLSASQRARAAALVGGKYTGLALGGAFLLRAVGKAYPELGQVIESVLGVVGL